MACNLNSLMGALVGIRNVISKVACKSAFIADATVLGISGAYWDSVFYRGGGAAVGQKLAGRRGEKIGKNAGGIRQGPNVG